MTISLKYFLIPQKKRQRKIRCLLLFYFYAFAAGEFADIFCFAL